MEVRDAVEADAEALAALADAPVDVMRNLVHDRTVRVAAAESPVRRSVEEADAPVEGSESTIDEADATADEADATVTGETAPTAAERSTDPASMQGFVSYDASGDVVYVTQLGGQPDTCRQLLSEPVRFARQEGMSVEVLVPTSQDDLQAAVEEAGFVREGDGPRFDGCETIRYRWRS